MPRPLFPRAPRAAIVCAVALLCAGVAGCQRQQSTPQLLADAAQYEKKGDHKAALIQLKNAVAQSPNDGEARMRLGALQLEVGDPVSAEKEVRKAISLNVPAARTLPLLARSLQAQGQYQQVLDALTPAAAQRSPELLSLRGDALLARGKTADAEAAYQQALALNPNSGAALTGLARHAVLQRDEAGARRFAQQAVERDARNPEVWMFQGALLRGLQQPDQALAAFERALALEPTHRSAHLEKAALYIAQSQFPAARTALAAARKNAPGSLMVTYTDALLNFSEGKFPAARESVQKVLKSAPGHLPSLLLAGAIELNLGAPQQAEQHLRAYLDAAPNNVYARKLLAQALLKNAQPDAAAAALAPALQASAQDAQLLALAGESFMQARDFDKASAYFAQASALAPKAAVLHTSLGLARLNQGQQDKAVSELRLATELDPASSSAALALVQAEMQGKRYDKALAAVQQLEQRQPDNAQVQNVKGGVYVAKGDLAAARAAYDKALALQPDFFTAVSNLAQLDVLEKKPQAAKQRFEAFLTRQPNNYGALSGLAQLALLQGQPAEATRWLERAHNANPDALPPALRLGAHYLATGDAPKALTLARKLQTGHASNPEVLDLLGKAQLASKDSAGALDTYSKLAAAQPKSAAAQLRLAGVQAGQKNETAAADSLQRAVSLAPDLLDARVAQVELALRRGRTDEALAFARQTQRQPKLAAVGRLLEGDVLMQQKKFAQAVPLYRQALAAQPSPQLVIKTADALRQSGQGSAAQQVVTAWQKAHPGEPVVALYAAETALAQQQYKAAIAMLQEVLKTDPNNPVALNNLAWAYQQDKDPRALATAEQALKVAGDNAAVMDTLGWLLVERGDTARALPLLQKATTLAPRAADIRYHLAVGLHKAGDKAAARKELDQVLAQDAPRALQEQARSLRAAL